jgi:hypothetical protein
VDPLELDAWELLLEPPVPALVEFMVSSEPQPRSMIAPIGSSQRAAEVNERASVRMANSLLRVRGRKTRFDVK